MTVPTLGSWLVFVMREADGALSLEDALHIIMDSLKKYFPCQSAAVVLIDDDTKETRIKIARQISYTFSKSFSRNEPSATVERVVKENAPLLLNNIDPNSDIYKEIKLEHDYTSAVLVPVVKNQRGIGYIFCDRSDTEQFTEPDSLHLQVVGYLIGSLMEKFDLIKSSKKLSTIDDATQALQYKAFVPALGTELQRARMHSYAVTLSLVSVNLFRKYVDMYGINDAHTLLANVVQVMKKHLRDVDLVARFGADEFIIYLSATDEAAATKTLEEIRDDVAKSVPSRDNLGPAVLTTGAIALEGGAILGRPMQELLGSVGKLLIEAKSQRHQRVNIKTLR